ncbi:hypothetical protein E4U19_003865 [Claviceps sp. Clav32 group G5]|nr:hypothetical protein E4U40_005346 [Claviceps sp. LM458 group G5]KAG6024272.1 hypothetical protein E4U19_003865 [Claviceps sp. Clav32 group G5]KAG6043041.1 hypothetical protein E4U39_005107 [Claviceps sp. Clav50 group G5]
MRDEERLEISTGKRSTIGVNTCDAQSDIIDISADGRLRPGAKVQLLRRVPLLKYRLLRMQTAADERRRNARMQSSSVHKSDVTELPGENAETVQALSSAAGYNAFERFGVESEAPVAYKSFEQGKLLEYRGRFRLCVCRRATERRWKSLLFTTSTCLNDWGIKILHRIASIVVQHRLSSYRIDHCRRKRAIRIGLMAGMERRREGDARLRQHRRLIWLVQKKFSRVSTG